MHDNYWESKARTLPEVPEESCREFDVVSGAPNSINTTATQCLLWCILSQTAVALRLQRNNRRTARLFCHIAMAKPGGDVTKSKWKFGTWKSEYQFLLAQYFDSWSGVMLVAETRLSQIVLLIGISWTLSLSNTQLHKPLYWKPARVVVLLFRVW